MKKTALLVTVLIGLASFAGSASAYGGGGFPPGYFGNPHARPGLVCEFVTKDVGRHAVTVPRCTVHHDVQANAATNRGVGERINAFFHRVWNG